MNDEIRLSYIDVDAVGADALTLHSAFDDPSETNADGYCLQCRERSATVQRLTARGHTDDN